MDNAPVKEIQGRPPKPSRRPSYHSDWSDSDNDNDKQGPLLLTCPKRRTLNQALLMPGKTLLLEDPTLTQKF